MRCPRFCAQRWALGGAGAYNVALHVSEASEDRRQHQAPNAGAVWYKIQAAYVSQRARVSGAA